MGPILKSILFRFTRYNFYRVIGYLVLSVLNVCVALCTGDNLVDVSPVVLVELRVVVAQIRDLEELIPRDS